MENILTWIISMGLAGFFIYHYIKGQDVWRD